MGIWWNRVEHSNPFIDDPMLKEIVVPEDHFVFKTMDGALVGRQGTVLPSQFAGVKETKECTREIEVHSWNDGNIVIKQRLNLQLLWDMILKRNGR